MHSACLFPTVGRRRHRPDIWH